jgi:hypothetical protein
VQQKLPSDFPLLLFISTYEDALANTAPSLDLNKELKFEEAVLSVQT